MLNLILGFVLGLVLGSLVDCLAARAIREESFWGRSYCEHCKHKLSWYDLFPILSFLLLKGKCRYCHKKITQENLLVEILMGLLVGLLFFVSFPQDWIQALELLFKTFVVVILVTVFITDLKTGLIYDRITYPAIIITLIYLLLSMAFKTFTLYQTTKDSVIGGYLLKGTDYFYQHSLDNIWILVNALLAALLIGLFFGGLIFVTRGRGLGGGDLKLGIFIGLALGFPNALLALFIAFLVGSVVGIGLLLSKVKKFGQTIPFGPFLSLGALISLFWGQQIISWYLNTFSTRGSIF